MYARCAVQELTEKCMEISSSLESHKGDRNKREELVLEHIKEFSNKKLRIIDFQAGERSRDCLAFAVVR